jgi:hypothetical protein
MGTSKFELRNGVSIRIHSKGVVLTNQNMSDELAEAALKEKPHHVQNFLKYDAAVLKKLDIEDPEETKKKLKEAAAKEKATATAGK